MNKSDLKSYAVRSKNQETLKFSTSGGLFTPIAEWVTEQGGYVCGAAFDKDYSVKHFIISGTEKNEDISIQSFQGSKYVQSNLGDCYRTIQSLLVSGMFVCFIGTTCQVEGLKAFLGKEFENLFTVDLVCHGMPSPKLWMKYINFQTEKYGSEIDLISFRSKVFGYHSGGWMGIRFQNGKRYYASAKTDLTLFDCWHFSRLVPGIRDDDGGYTAVIVQTGRGEKMLEALEDRIYFYEMDTSLAVELDGRMVSENAIPHPKRNAFYNNLDFDTLPEHIQKFIPVHRGEYVVEKIKSLMYHVGIMQRIKLKMKQ